MASRDNLESRSFTTAVAALGARAGSSLEALDPETFVSLLAVGFTTAVAGVISSIQLGSTRLQGSGSAVTCAGLLKASCKAICNCWKVNGAHRRPARPHGAGYLILSPLGQIDLRLRGTQRVSCTRRGRQRGVLVLVEALQILPEGGPEDWWGWRRRPWRSWGWRSWGWWSWDRGSCSSSRGAFIWFTISPFLNHDVHEGLERRILHL